MLNDFKWVRLFRVFRLYKINRCLSFEFFLGLLILNESKDFSCSFNFDFFIMGLLRGPFCFVAVGFIGYNEVDAVLYSLYCGFVFVFFNSKSVFFASRIN